MVYSMRLPLQVYNNLGCFDIDHCRQFSMGIGSRYIMDRYLKNF